MKKRIAILLAAVMLFVFAGCQTTVEPSGSQPSGTSVSASGGASGEAEGNASDIMTPYGRYEEPLKVTVSKTLNTNPGFTAGQSETDNWMIDYIRERLNVEVEVIWQAEANEYVNKLSLNISAGDVPDLVYIPGGNYLVFRNMVNNNMLADLSDAYESCMGDYMKSTMDSYGGRNLTPLTIDGKIMAFPGASIGYLQQALMIRKDWLDALGLDMPSSMEDVISIAKEFIERDPGGNGPGNTIGLVVNGAAPVSGYGNLAGLEPIFYAVGAYPKAWMRDDNGQAYYGSTAPEMKEALETIAGMYKDGIIDKSFMATRTADEIAALLRDGRSGMFYGGWNRLYMMYEGAKLVPEMDWVPCFAPLNENGKMEYVTGTPIGDIIAVNGKFSNPEVLLKILNVEFDVLRGFDGEAYTEYNRLFVEESVVTYSAIMPTCGVNLDYFDTVPLQGSRVKEYVENGTLVEDSKTTQQLKDLAVNAKNYNESRDVEDQVGWVAYYSRYIGASTTDNPVYEMKDAAFYFATESFASLKPNLDKLEEEMYFKIIVGEEPIEYFDEFVRLWNELGGDKLTQEVQELIE